MASEKNAKPDSNLSHSHINAFEDTDSFSANTASDETRSIAGQSVILGSDETRSEASYSQIRGSDKTSSIAALSYRSFSSFSQAIGSNERSTTPNTFTDGSDETRSLASYSQIHGSDETSSIASLSFRSFSSFSQAIGSDDERSTTPNAFVDGSDETTSQASYSQMHGSDETSTLASLSLRSKVSQIYGSDETWSEASFILHSDDTRLDGARSFSQTSDTTVLTMRAKDVAGATKQLEVTKTDKGIDTSKSAKIGTNGDGEFEGKFDDKTTKSGDEVGGKSVDKATEGDVEVGGRYADKTSKGGDEVGGKSADKTTKSGDEVEGKSADKATKGCDGVGGRSADTTTKSGDEVEEKAADIATEGDHEGGGQHKTQRIPRVRMHGVRTDVDIEMRAMKYDRYKCKYNAPYPGGYLLRVEWSGLEIPGSPFKVNITNKGNSDKVTVEGPGLKGGYVGQELRAVVDTTSVGNGEVTTDCSGLRHTARCDQIDHRNGKYTLRIFPTEACRHKLDVKYGGDHVPGSPFSIPVGEPPDPRKVRVYGPGVEPGVIQKYESKFIVETYGAGAGQLSVRIRGPRGAFKVDMRRDREDERTILCRYDPEEPGEYILTIKWSGVHVPGSPFQVPVFESREALYKHAKNTQQIELIADYQWKEDI